MIILMEKDTAKRTQLRDMISVRQIMKDLRDLSIQDIAPEERLDKIVVMVAQRLRVDVCSCYLSRPGGILELSATWGLDKKGRENPAFFK